MWGSTQSVVFIFRIYYLDCFKAPNRSLLCSLLTSLDEKRG